MKIGFYRIGFILSVFAFAACSKSRPPHVILDQAVEKTLPAHLVAKSTNYQYSPIKEVLGTTLPEGSCQVDFQTTVKTKEPLYILGAFSSLAPHAPFPEEIRAKVEELKELAEWSWYGTDYEGATKRKAPKPRLYGFLVPMAEAGQEKTCWVKVVAEPRGSEWHVTVVEGEPENLFSSARPKSAVDPKVFIYGSDEQLRNVAEVQAAYSDAGQREKILKQLKPEISALEKSEPSLVERYEKEMDGPLEKAVVESREAGADHYRRVQETSRATGAIHDDYKTCNKLINLEAARYVKVRQAFDDQIKELQAKVDDVRARVHAEIAEKIRELMRQHGLAP